MPAYKDKAKGTWYASFYYEDWTGKKVKKMKRGFPTKREALEWERTFLQQQTADLEMTFENFVAVYVADMKGRIKENTWGTKEHILYKKLVPYFGKRKMCDIHSKEVIAWQNEMLGYRDKNGKPYSPVYLKTLHMTPAWPPRPCPVKLRPVSGGKCWPGLKRAKPRYCAPVICSMRVGTAQPPKCCSWPGLPCPRCSIPSSWAAVCGCLPARRA